MISLLISLLLTVNLVAAADTMPSWITKGSLSDSTYHYVVCSQDGLDPEEAKQTAESKCLASAAKLGGVNVKLTQKTVQSLTGSDSSEVAEIDTIRTKINCEWTHRYLEPIKDGYRLWLRCRLKKSELLIEKNELVKKISSGNTSIKEFKYRLFLTTIPKVDKIIVSGKDGDKVYDPESNVVELNLKSSDSHILVRKAGFKDSLLDLTAVSEKDKLINQTIVLDKY